MTTKLTLTMDKSVIERAKKYAKREERSLSNLLENYLKALTYEKKYKKENLNQRILVYIRKLKQLLLMKFLFLR